MAEKLAAGSELFVKLAERKEHFRNIQDHTMGLYRLERRCSYPDFERSTRYCMDLLKRSGFEKIERIAHRADGKTASCDLVMPQAWEMTGRSYLEITSPGVADYDRVLADSDVNPAAAVIWGAPSPEGGIDAEVVDYDTLDERSDVRGKIVFFAGERIQEALFGKVFHEAAARGAAALAMSCFSAEKYEPDELYWYNGLGYYGWYLTADDPKMPLFSLSPRRARFLKELLKRGKVTAHAEMKTRLYEGEIYTVTGIIPGESEEEYALLAHMYEPFPGDDALGVALGAEVGRVLKDSGVRPKRTLRAVFSMELYGFAAFLADPARHDRIFAALSLDGFTHRCSPEINLRDAALASPFFGDLWFRDNVRRLLPEAPLKETFGSYSDDTFANDPAFGIPTNWLYNPSGVWHHNTGVGFLPDWELVERRFPALADTVCKLVSDTRFPDYAPEALREYRAEAAAIAGRNDLSAREKAFRLRARCEFQLARLASMKPFTEIAADEAPFRAVLNEALAALPAPEPLAGIDAELDGIVAERFEPGCPSSLAKVPLAEKRHFASVGLRSLFAGFDGKRSVLEALELAEADSGTRSTAEARRATLECLRYLERYGYVRLSGK